MKNSRFAFCASCPSLVIVVVASAVAGFSFASTSASCQTRQADRTAASTPVQSAPRAGERTFASICSGCHGLDGQGSGRAPSIAGSAKVRHFSDAQVFRIISNGVPGTGMPAFRALSPQKVREIVSYLRILQGKGGTRSLPGDAARGKTLFFGKAECSTCHSMHGAGGFLGPDLSAYGDSISAQGILDAILTSNRIVPAGYRPATITMHDGSRLEGLIRNEDNFSLQIQTSDGSFHFLQKSGVQNVEYASQSLMPTNYRERLTSSELDDLVNFIMSSGSGSSTTRHETEESEEPH